MSELQCRACGSIQGRVVYECSEIPVQSCVMLETAAAARDYPVADLRLFLCERCGFLGNLLFDYEAQGPLTGYETSQAFSGHFSAYQSELCNTLRQRHDLTQRGVVEVGCGSGEFLTELCDTAECRGTGFDPVFPDSLARDALEGRCTFRREAFTTDHVGLPFDLLACRHTLEHIQYPETLVKLCRQASAVNRDSHVFFEVPDMLRILQDNAFWDVYYEHCSYFSAGSLARLFRRCGFRIVDLERVYDDQYLLITATPGGETSDPVFDAEDDLERMLRNVASFEHSVEQTLAGWRERLGAARENGERVALWGSGSKAAGFLATLRVKDQIPYIVDINPRKQGLFQAGTGQEIVAPDRLQEYRPDLLIIMNAAYRDEISAELRKMGLAPEIHAL